MQAVADAKCARCFFDFRDMAGSNAHGAYPYTPPIQLIYGMRESLDMLFVERLDNVFARHFRIAEGVRGAAAAWGLRLCAKDARLHSDTVSAILVPASFDSGQLVEHAYAAYGVSFWVGLGEMKGRAFRIGHLGVMSDVTALSGLAAIEMAVVDLG